MVAKKLFVCLLLFSICNGLTINLANSKLCLTGLRLQIEANITSIRDYVSTTLTSLDELITHLSLKIDVQVNSTKTLVKQLSSDALAANQTISHCVRGLKFLSSNLDMYSLSSCRCAPDYIEDVLYEAKNLSRTLLQKKSDCLQSNLLNLVKVNLCIQDAYDEALAQAESLFEEVSVLKEKMLEDKLNCLQENFNIIDSELCLLTCQFQECAIKNCRSGSKNDWISEALNQTSILLS